MNNIKVGARVIVKYPRPSGTVARVIEVLGEDRAYDYRIEFPDGSTVIVFEDEIEVIPEPLRIDAPDQLAAFAGVYGLRHDWHEPDESGIDAYVVGDHLDNAERASIHVTELNVVLTHDGGAVAVVNLADLLSWAASK